MEKNCCCANALPVPSAKPAAKAMDVSAVVLSFINVSLEDGIARLASSGSCALGWTPMAVQALNLDLIGATAQWVSGAENQQPVVCTAQFSSNSWT
jgi:hypothetical protein